ncbi:hypothetical protein SDC9_189830 [bioreactor metagenome]|uniref:Uncharacterized protein n=1 Tax=bioreactor metagenome TaxID=1076179 RepID=A0A645I464_9ZZZZ
MHLAVAAAFASAAAFPPSGERKKDKVPYPGFPILPFVFFHVLGLGAAGAGNADSVGLIGILGQLAAIHGLIAGSQLFHGRSYDFLSPAIAQPFAVFAQGGFCGAAQLVITAVIYVPFDARFHRRNMQLLHRDPTGSLCGSVLRCRRDFGAAFF